MLNLVPESTCQYLNDYLERGFGDVLKALRLMQLSPIRLAFLMLTQHLLTCAYMLYEKGTFLRFCSMCH